MKRICIFAAGLFLSTVLWACEFVMIRDVIFAKSSIASIKREALTSIRVVFADKTERIIMFETEGERNDEFARVAADLTKK